MLRITKSHPLTLYKTKMIPLEIWTIAISVAALVVSGTSLYFSRFHKKVSMQAVLLSWQPIFMGGESQDYATFEYSMANTGTEQLLVKDCILKSRSGVFSIDTSNENIPLVLKPKEIVLSKVECSMDMIELARKDGNFIKIEIEAYSTNMEKFVASKKISPVTNYSKSSSNKSVEPFTLKKERKKDTTRRV